MWNKFYRLKCKAIFFCILIDLHQRGWCMLTMEQLWLFIINVNKSINPFLIFNKVNKACFLLSLMVIKNLRLQVLKIKSFRSNKFILRIAQKKFPSPCYVSHENCVSENENETNWKTFFLSFSSLPTSYALLFILSLFFLIIVFHWSKHSSQTWQIQY